MDQNRIQQQKALAEQKKYQKLKKVTKLLFSVSVFSFFFARPSWIFPFLHSSELHFSTFPLHIFNHTIDKNCMFLLCNGLLVFLANYSGLVRCLSSSRRCYDPFKLYEYGSLSESMMLQTEKPLFEREVAEEREYVRTIEAEKEEREMEERIVSVAEDDSEVEDNGVLSTEELNRKFDEFIRRMKEEITIDARRTLVVV